jgi:hypothetical protein
MRPHDRQFWFVQVACLAIATVSARLVVFLLAWLLGPPSSNLEPAVAAWGTILVVYFAALYAWFRWTASRPR